MELIQGSLEVRQPPAKPSHGASWVNERNRIVNGVVVPGTDWVALDPPRHDRVVVPHAHVIQAQG